jgi:hypothetical protein
MLGARTGGVEFGVDPVASGGPLRELSNGNVKITSKGVGVVENHGNMGSGLALTHSAKKFIFNLEI